MTSPDPFPTGSIRARRRFVRISRKLAPQNTRPFQLVCCPTQPCEPAHFAPAQPRPARTSAVALSGNLSARSVPFRPRGRAGLYEFP